MRAYSVFAKCVRRSNELVFAKAPECYRTRGVNLFVASVTVRGDPHSVTHESKQTIKQLDAKEGETG